MAETFKTRRDTVKAGIALSLAFAAGCVDIIGYISFGHVFTAHLTGNTVRLAQGIIDARGEQITDAAAVIAMFFIGSIVGRTAIEVGSRLAIRSVAVMSLCLEAALIAAVIPWSAYNMRSLMMLAAAMGVQTATLTRVGPLTVHTTFVTGMLNKLAQLVTHASFHTYDAIRGSKTAAAARSKVLSQSSFIWGVWFSYLVGAAVGTFTKSRWGTAALLLLAALVAFLAVLDLIWPLAIQEEKDASER